LDEFGPANAGAAYQDSHMGKSDPLQRLARHCDGSLDHIIVGKHGHASLKGMKLI
jgi:hypothetical protein